MSTKGYFSQLETDLELISLHGFLLPLSCIFFANPSLILCCLIINMLFCYQCDPLFVVVYLPSGSLFWVRSLRSIWESNTSRFHLGCWISKWVTGFFLWNGVPSPGSWSLGHMPFMVLICFLVTCHTHMYLHLFVLMIGQLLCNNFVCMAIKIFWLDLTWLDLKLLVKLRITH